MNKVIFKRTIQKSLKPMIGLLLICAIFMSPRVFADTLVLRNGKTYNNVKTKIKQGQIYVYRQNRKALSFPASQIKKITPKAVNWPVKVVVKKKSVIKKEPKTVVIKEQPETSLLFDQPWMLALQGLTPLWSGMYRSEEHRYYGYMFTLLESFAIANLSRWTGTPASRESTDLTTLFLYAVILTPPPPPPPANAPTMKYPEAFVLLSLQGQVESPDGGYINKSKYDQSKNNAIAILAGLLITDAVVSYFYGHDSEVSHKSRSGDYDFDFSSKFESIAPRQDLAPVAVNSMRHDIAFSYHF